jgi:subtilase family serine protease
VLWISTSGSTCSGTVTYSEVGTYSAWAQADTYGSTAELDETNNTAEQALTVIYGFGGLLSPLQDGGTIS